MLLCKHWTWAVSPISTRWYLLTRNQVSGWGTRGFSALQTRYRLQAPVSYSGNTKSQNEWIPGQKGVGEPIIVLFSRIWKRSPVLFLWWGSCLWSVDQSPSKGHVWVEGEPPERIRASHDAPASPHELPSAFYWRFSEIITGRRVKKSLC